MFVTGQSLAACLCHPCHRLCLAVTALLGCSDTLQLLLCLGPLTRPYVLGVSARRSIILITSALDSANTARLVMGRKGIFRDKDREEGTGPGFVGPEVYTILRALFKTKNTTFSI